MASYDEKMGYVPCLTINCSLMYFALSPCEAPLYRKLIEEGKGEWIEHPAFGKIFQPDLSCVPAELLRPAPVDQVKRMERKRDTQPEANPEWMEKQLQSVQIDTQQVNQEDQGGIKLQEQITRLQSIPKRKEEARRYSLTLKSLNRAQCHFQPS